MTVTETEVNTFMFVFCFIALEKTKPVRVGNEGLAV